jgi:hypothetical protein
MGFEGGRFAFIQRFRFFMRKLSHCVLLVSRYAMLEDAKALAEIIGRADGLRATLILSGEVSNVVINFGFDSSVKCDVAVDTPIPFVEKFGGIGAFRSIVVLLKIALRKYFLRKRFSEERPDALVVFEDRFIDPEAIWLAEFSKRKIPAVLVRYASSSAESDAWSRRGRISHSLDRGILSGLRRKFASSYPHHVWNDGRGPQLFYSLWDSYALAIAGMAGTRPWAVGGGALVAACVQGAADQADAVRLTGLSERFIVTGQPSWDRLYKALKQPRSARQRPRVVCAWPQWAEHGQLPWPVHMDRLGRLAVTLGASGAEVILCLHPKAQRSLYSGLAQRHGLVISDRPLSEEFPRTDLFVASWSSTLRWAAMLGVAAVNLDWAGQNYDLFGELKSLPTSVTPEDLGPLLAELLEMPGKRVSVGSALKQESAVYGFIDGKACERIQRLIEQVVELT